MSASSSWENLDFESRHLQDKLHIQVDVWDLIGRRKIKMVAPRVSVVMSTFNDEATVGAAIKSIQRQAFSDWEFVVVNDGSSDETSKRVREFAIEDSRIRLLEQGNRGLTEALIVGCHAARGELIARQDADDWSFPDRLQHQANAFASDPGLGFVSCGAESVVANGVCLEAIVPDLDSETATYQLSRERKGPPAHGTVMFRKQVFDQVGGYRKAFYYGQDSDLWLRMAEVSRFGYVPTILYRFLRSPNSISGNQRSVQREFGLLAEQCAEARRACLSEQQYLDKAMALTQEIRVRVRDVGDVARDSMAMNYLLGSQLVVQGRREGRPFLWHVLKRRPLHLRAWFRLLQSVVRR